MFKTRNTITALCKGVPVKTTLKNLLSNQNHKNKTAQAKLFKLVLIYQSKKRRNLYNRLFAARWNAAQVGEQNKRILMSCKLETIVFVLQNALIPCCKGPI